MHTLNAVFWNVPDPMQWAIGVWLFAFGACAGSFMNVVIWRLPLGRSVVYPGSRCPNCGHAVRSYDNIPILNWLILRGRCRDCSAKISWRYPAVETLVAGLFVVVAIAEPLRQGGNLPRFPEASPYHWPGLIALWVFYASQMLLLCTLVCAAFMWFDGNRPPIRLFVPAFLGGLVVPLVWPEVRPEQWLEPLRFTTPQIEIICESIVAVALAALLAFVVGHFLYRSVDSPRLRWKSAVYELVPCGLLFGATAFSRIALLAAVLRVLVAVVGRFRNRRQRIPWSATLVAAVVVQIAIWKQSSTWIEANLDGFAWIAVPVAMLLSVALVACVSTIEPPAVEPPPAWNRDWPIQRRSLPVFSQSDPNDTNLERIMRSSSYKLADHDIEFLQRPELRPVRLQLELLKPEMAFIEQGIKSTVVVFGGTQVLEKAAAEKRLADAKAAAAAAPDDTLLARQVSRFERLLAKSHFYDAAREFARLASSCQMSGECDFVVVTGGGPGIMEAANRGAADIQAKSIGLNITLPEEQRPNQFITPELCFQFRYFALRKMHLVLRAKALVVFPGGFGTLDELFEVLTLRQTKRMQAIPVILYAREYWNRVVDFQFLADEGVIADEHLALIEYAESPQEAWDRIRGFHNM